MDLLRRLVRRIAQLGLRRDISRQIGFERGDALLLRRDVPGLLRDRMVDVGDMLIGRRELVRLLRQHRLQALHHVHMGR